MTSKSDYEALVRTQKAKKHATHEKVLEAIRAIEREIAEHGFYPANNGKVTLTEVAQRAGIGGTTLRNPHHHDTRKIIQNWLTQLKQSAATTKPKARAVAREKIVWFEEQMKKMNAEALNWRKEVTALTEEKLDLENQIKTMSSSSDTKVVGFKSRANDDDCN